MAGLDGRSAEARSMKRNRNNFVRHVGGSPSAVQLALIDRIVMLGHQLSMLDRKRTVGSFTDHDSRAYLAWSNSHARLLKQLGLKGAAERPMTLQDHVARRVAERSAA